MSRSLAERRNAHLARLLGRFFHAHAPEDAPLPRGPLLRPHTRGKRFTFSHYNVVIPDLPAPHRHLTCLALIGTAGVEAFDLDDMVADTPRTTATLAVGTAAPGASWFRRYSTRRDCHFEQDGSHIQIGENLTLTGTFPDYEIVVEQPELRLDITAHCTGQVTWFARSPVYQHLGYPATYQGTLTWKGRTQQISGILSLEHARALSLTAIRDAAVPPPLKLPWNFFTYQVIKLAPDTLLMLASAEAFQQPVLTGAWIKQTDGRSRRHVDDSVVFEVLRYQDRPHIAPNGAEMLLPAEFRWRIHNDDGAVTTEINARYDTDPVFGIGQGWIGGYSYNGHHDGKPITGTGYIEYVRTRPTAPNPTQRSITTASKSPTPQIHPRVRN
ncbi:DUF6670 family protein [Nocardia niigatensis]